MDKDDIRQPNILQQGSKKGWILASLAIIVVVLAGWLAYSHYSASNPIPKSIRSQLKITLYYPKGMPAGYSVDTSSIALAENQALTFNILSTHGESIGVSEQALPPKLDLSAPDPGGIQPGIFDTPIGKATIRPAGNQRIGYIAAGDTLIIFNIGNTPATDVQAIAKDFKKI